MKNDIFRMLICNGNPSVNMVINTHTHTCTNASTKHVEPKKGKFMPFIYYTKKTGRFFFNAGRITFHTNTHIVSICCEHAYVCKNYTRIETKTIHINSYTTISTLYTTRILLLSVEERTRERGKNEKKIEWLSENEAKNDFYMLLLLF